MRVNRISYFIPVLICFLTSWAWGQQGNAYYYYQGKKVPLTLDRNSITVIWEEPTKENVTGLNKRLDKDGLPELSKITEIHHLPYLETDKEKINNKELNHQVFFGEVSTDKSSGNSYELLKAKYEAVKEVVMVAPVYRTKTDELIKLTNTFRVKLNKLEDKALLFQKAEELGVKICGQLRDLPLWFELECDKSKDKTTLDWAAIFYETGLFAQAEPEMSISVYPSSALITDPRYDEQWYLNNTGQNNGITGIDIRAQWYWGNIPAVLSPVNIGIFDSGFQMNNPDLAANVGGQGYDTVSGNNQSVIYDSHGTWVAGIAGAVKDNDIQIKGVVKSPLFSISENQSNVIIGHIVNGFTWARNNNIKVLNCSWNLGEQTNLVDDAIRAFLEADRVLVFSSGNANTAVVSYPANVDPRILVVGGINRRGERFSPNTLVDPTPGLGSQYGPELDIMAGGARITLLDAGVGDGTSLAAPQVSGVAALILSIKPDLSAEKVRNIIERSARKIRSDIYVYGNQNGRDNGRWNQEMGYGLLDAAQAVYMTKGYFCTDYDINVATDVPNQIVDYRKATHILTASNSIPFDSGASYAALEEVRLSDGFTSNSGSNFIAYIAANCGDDPKIPDGAAALAQAVVNKDSDTNDALNINSLKPEKVNKISEIKVYPNPSSGIFNIKSPTPVIKISVIGIDGRVMKEFSFKEKLSEYKIDLSNVQSGMYILHILTDQGVKDYKVLKH